MSFPKLTSTYPKRIQKVVGGRYTTANEFPYHVSLQRIRMHFCGGSLISTSHVLTAGHCVQPYVYPIKYSLSLLKVVAGLSSMYDSDGQTFDTQQIYLHPYFKKTLYGIENDIAVIKVQIIHEYNWNKNNNFSNIY